MAEENEKKQDDKFKVSALSDKELDNLIKSATKEQRKRIDREKNVVHANLKRMAEMMGMDVVPKTGKEAETEEKPEQKPELGKIYQHPDNEDLIWEFKKKGRPPKWLRELVSEGYDYHDLEVGKEEETPAEEEETTEETPQEEPRRGYFS